MSQQEEEVVVAEAEAQGVDEKKQFDTPEELKAFYVEHFTQCNGFVVSDRDQCRSVAIPEKIVAWAAPLAEGLPLEGCYPYKQRNFFKNLLDSGTRLPEWDSKIPFSDLAEFIRSPTDYKSAQAKDKAEFGQWGHDCDLCEAHIDTAAFYRDAAREFDVCFKCAETTEEGAAEVAKESVKKFNTDDFYVPGEATSLGSLLDWLPLYGIGDNYVAQNVNAESKYAGRFALVTHNIFCCSDISVRILPASYDAAKLNAELVTAFGKIGEIPEMHAHLGDEFKLLRMFEEFEQALPDDEDDEDDSNSPPTISMEAASFLALQMLRAKRKRKNGDD